jgi:proteasome accessory factor B
MPKPYSRIHRLLRLVTIVQSRTGLNATQLAKELGTTPRNVYRDLKELGGAGVPIYFDQETEGYRVRHDFFLPPVQLTLDEGLALIVLGERIGKEERVPFTGAGGRALEIVRGLLPRQMGESLEAVTPHVHVRLAASENGEGHRDVYETVRKSIADRRALRCAYEPGGAGSRGADADDPGTGEAFVFKPYCLFFNQRAWYAAGWRSDREEVRNLRLSRFVRCEETDQPYAIPEDFTLANHLGKAWRMIRDGKIHRVELRFDAQVADTVEETHWHETQQVENHEDGSITFRCEVDGLKEIVWWVMGYGPHCRVVKPKALRELVVRLAQQTSKLYSKK